MSSPTVSVDVEASSSSNAHGLLANGYSQDISTEGVWRFSRTIYFWFAHPLSSCRLIMSLSQVSAYLLEGSSRLTSTYTCHSRVTAVLTPPRSPRPSCKIRSNLRPSDGAVPHSSTKCPQYTFLTFLRPSLRFYECFTLCLLQHPSVSVLHYIPLIVLASYAILLSILSCIPRLSPYLRPSV